LELRGGGYEATPEDEARTCHPTRDLFETDRERAGSHARTNARSVGQ
jgi:hypothetical protein